MSSLVSTLRCATAFIFLAVHNHAILAKFVGLKEVDVHQCPLCCQEGHVLSFQYTGGLLSDLDPEHAVKVLSDERSWKCVKFKPGKRRELHNSQLNNRSQLLPFHMRDSDISSNDRQSSRSLNGKVEELLNTLASLAVSHVHDKCQLQSDYLQCKNYMKRGLCSWQRISDAGDGVCKTPGFHPPPPAKEFSMKLCLAAGIDCNEAAGGICFVKPSGGYYPPIPTCLYPLEQSAQKDVPVTNFVCSNMKQCIPPKGELPMKAHTKGYCRDKNSKATLLESMKSKLRSKLGHFGTSSTQHKPPELPILSKCAESMSARNSARPKGAPASCGSDVCAFEKEAFALEANSTSLFCANVLAGKLSHREMELFCKQSASGGSTKDSGWGTGSAAASCSQCTEFCEKKNVRNISQIFEESCGLSDAFSTELCPNGTMYVDGRCFWLDQGFRTRQQSQGVCQRVAQKVYGVTDWQGLNGKARPRARTAILNTESLQCVSVGLYSQIHGTAKHRGEAPWCGSDSKQTQKQKPSKHEAIPYNYAVARGWIGLSIMPGITGGPVWEDGSAFEWNNFLSNDAFGNSTLLLNDGNGKGLDVFAAADVESGVWYSVERPDGTSNAPFRAYTICEFDADSTWHESNVSHVAGAKADCSLYKVLTVRVQLNESMSHVAATNLTQALASVLAATLDVPGFLISHAPQCSLQDTTAGALSSWHSHQGTGATSSVHHGRVLENNDASVHVTYTVPLDVTDEAVKNIDVVSLADATTEHVYILSYDEDVINAAPTIESIDVHTSDEESDSSNETDASSNILMIAVVAGVAVALSVIGIVMVLYSRKRKRHDASLPSYLETDDISSSSSERDPPGFTTEGTTSPHSSSESESEVTLNTHSRNRKSNATPPSDLSKKITKERKPALGFKPKKRVRIDDVHVSHDKLPPPARMPTLRSQAAACRETNNPVMEIEMGALEVTRDMEGSANSRLSWKSVGSWDGTTGLEPNPLELDELMTFGNSLSGSFDAEMPGMNDDLSILLEGILPIEKDVTYSTDIFSAIEKNLEDGIPMLPEQRAGSNVDVQAGQSMLNKMQATNISHSDHSSTTAQDKTTSAGRQRRTSSADERDKLQALNARRKCKKWTSEEDAHILAYVKTHGPSNWKKMGVSIGRTGAQCSQRWRKVLNPEVKRFVKWTPEEDARLIEIHKEHPDWTNKQIASQMLDRTPTQCHNRWNDKVNPTLRWGNWKPEEDRIIWEKRKIGHSWSKIVKENPVLINRAHVAVKNRWHSLELARKRASKKKTRKGL